jgi:hypothetical protein
MHLTRLLQGIALMLAGLACFYVYVQVLESYEHKRNARSQWPTAQGKVTSFDLDGEITGGDNVMADVGFTYSVDGVQYRSRQKWNVGEEFFGSEPGEAIAARRKYSQGAGVRVYYNPDRPSQAVLEPNAIDFDWRHYPYGLVFFAGLGLLGFGLIKGISGLYAILPAFATPLLGLLAGVAVWLLFDAAIWVAIFVGLLVAGPIALARRKPRQDQLVENLRLNG